MAVGIMSRLCSVLHLSPTPAGLQRERYFIAFLVGLHPPPRLSDGWKRGPKTRKANPNGDLYFTSSNTPLWVPWVWVKPVLLGGVSFFTFTDHFHNALGLAGGTSVLSFR